MSDSDDITTLKKSDLEQESMVSLDISGKSDEIWNERKPRFLERLVNSFKKMLGSDIPTSATANNELLEASEVLVESGKSAIKLPQLKNAERQVSIILKLAEAKEKEANARKIGLEADKLELELEIEKVQQSQRIIDLLIQRGELVMIEQGGEITFIYKKREIK